MRHQGLLTLTLLLILNIIDLLLTYQKTISVNDATYYRNAVYIELLAQRSGLSSSA